MIEMTEALARAAATDAADRNMKQAGRIEWNEEDWDVGCETYERLWPLENRL
jgi:hypothetical protein